MPVRVCIDVDKNGTTLIGYNDDGLWIGTEDAPSVLGDPNTSESGGPDRSPGTPKAWVVNGYLGSDPIVAYLIASDKERACNYVLGLGAKQVTIEGGKHTLKRYMSRIRFQI